MIGDIEGLILLFEFPTMLQLKPWRARGASHYPTYMCNYYCYTFKPYPPSRRVFLQGNEDVGLAKDLILLSLRLV